MKIEGLDWTPLERVYPCNWVGAYRDPLAGSFGKPIGARSVIRRRPGAQADGDANRRTA